MLQVNNQAYTIGLDETRVQVLESCLYVMLWTTLLALCAIPFSGPALPIGAYIIGFVPFFGVFGSSFYLLRRDHPRAAAWLMVLGTLALQCFVNFFNQGLEAQALASCLNLILIAGFAIGRSAAILTTALASLNMTVYLVLLREGLLPQPWVEADNGPKIVAAFMTIMGTCGIVVVALRHVNEALEDKVQRANLWKTRLELEKHLLEARTHDEMVQVLIEAVFDIEGIESARILDAQDQIIGSMGTPVPDAQETRVPIPGTQRAQVLTITAQAESSHTPAVLAFLHSAAGQAGEASARVTAEAFVLRAQKMDAIGRLSSGVAHDFNNLLTAILGGVELAQLQARQGRALDSELQSIRAATDSAIRLTQKMMAFNPSNNQDNRQVDLVSCLIELLPVLRQSLPPEIELNVSEPDKPIWVQARRLEIEQILLNLVHNARDAIDGQGQIRVQIHSPGEPGLPVSLVVSDDGMGMSEDVRARVFEPFYTTRSHEGGHGLGLTSVYTIVHQLKGQIGLESEPGKGTQFTIELPRSEEHGTQALSQDPLESNTGSPGPPRLGRILLVDDNPQVREVVEMMLQDCCQSLVSMETGDDALAYIRSGPSIDLLITDVLMPGMDGHQLLRQIREDGLTLPAILISGFSPEFQCDEDQLQPFWRLAKPFTRDQLLDLLHRVQTRQGTLSDAEC